MNEELRQIGIDGFVAHVSIEPDAEWQEEIEHALLSCDVLVGLLHPGFSASYWTQQEVGWALGRGIPVQMIRLGEDPVGFRAKRQARSPRNPPTPWSVASSIAVGLSTHPTFGPTVVARLVRSLFYCRCRMNGCQQAFPASGSPCRQQPFTPFLPDRVSGETQPPA